MKQRNHFADISKGLAIIMVTMTHYSWEKAERLQLYFPYWISMAVPIFMIVTGVMSTASYERKGVNTLKQAYAPQLLTQKAIRYTVPFLYMYLVELVIELIQGRQYTFFQMIKQFITGGIGVHGTYYYPVLRQMIWMVPLIYYIVKKWKWGIGLCFFMNLILEVWKNEIQMDSEVYRLTAFRYIFAIAMGCYIYLYKEKTSAWAWAGMWILGVSYIWKISYTDYQPEIFTRWKNTSMLSVLYMAPLFVWGMNKLSKVRCRFLESLGKASYHIFLFQIIYYNFICPYVMTILGSRVAELIISVCICLAGGYAYYLLYQYVSGKVRDFYHKEDRHERHTGFYKRSILAK